MKGKYTRAVALGLALSPTLLLTGCVAAPPRELSILDAVATGLPGRPQSCSARNAATVCVQTMRLNRVKDCSCMDRRQLIDDRFDTF